MNVVLYFGPYWQEGRKHQTHAHQERERERKRKRKTVGTYETGAVEGTYRRFGSV